MKVELKKKREREREHIPAESVVHVTDDLQVLRLPFEFSPVPLLEALGVKVANHLRLALPPQVVEHQLVEAEQRGKRKKFGSARRFQHTHRCSRGK